MLSRNSAVKVNALLKVFPAVLILGVRQSGKTTLARQVRADWKYFDLENINDIDFISDPDFFFKVQTFCFNPVRTVRNNY